MKPFILGIGGTTKSPSSTEHALRAALQGAAAADAETAMFGGPFLARLPIYDPARSERTAEEQEFLAAVSRADGLILASPAYHAGISGMVKNAIDLIEDLRGDARPYLDGRAVGCIVTAYGWQGGGTTLTSFRTIVHALRGWPTPIGATLNTAEKVFGPSGECIDAKVEGQLTMMAQQVVGFARRARADA
jgi:FMN reductase